MTSAESLYRELQALDVELSIDGRGRLSFDAPEGAMTEDRIDRIRSHRDELISILRKSEQIDAPELMPERCGCPWCGNRALDDDRNGFYCHPCHRLAWVRVGSSFIRGDLEIDLTKSLETHWERGG
jgi:hypothetical protein